MQRQRSSEPVRGQRSGLVDLVDVDEVEALGDGEAHRRPGGPREPLEDGVRSPDEGVVVVTGGDLEDREPDAVALADRVALDEPLLLQRGEQPPGRAAVQPTCTSELGDGRGLRGVRDRLEQRGGPLDRLHRARACAFVDLVHHVNQHRTMRP
jgi:hypothetical protein